VERLIIESTRFSEPSFMNHRILPYLLVFALVLGPIALSASAGAQPTEQPTLLSAAKKKHHPVRQRSVPAGQIACTPLGCQRISPSCHPEPDFDFFGNPTGYDRVVCG